MQLRDIMTKNVVSVDSQENLSSAAKMMRYANVGCLIVMNQQGQPQGIITDRDIAIRCVGEGHNPSVCQVATHMTSPIIWGEPQWDVMQTAQRMNEQQVKRLPVLENGQVVGLVSFSDIAQALEQPMRNLLLGVGAVRRLQRPTSFAA